MTLLFMDGCQGGDVGTKWNVTSTGARTTISPRFAGAAWYAGIGTLVKTITPSSELFVGAAYQYGTGAYSSLSLAGDAGATTHLTILKNASGLMEVRRGSSTGTLLATGTNPIPASWTHVQVRATIADSGGIVQVRLNGAATNEIDFLGDTRNGGTSTSIDTVSISIGIASAGWGVGDIVICNSAGSLNNTWPGDCRVVTLVPSGNGATSQGVNSAGNSTNNYSHVDELPYSGTDYVGITTPGNGDTYAMSDLPSGASTVFGVQVNMSVAKSDTGVASAKRRVRSGGTTYTGPAVLLGTTYVTVSEILETDPATGLAWTISGVNAAEAGFEGA